MIDLDEIKLWESHLEHEESSWNNYEKLAILYAIEDRHTEGRQSEEQLYSAYSTARAETLGDYGDSDFLHAIRGKDPTQAWAIMDELMDTLRVVNERVYNSVMRKIDAL